MEELKVNEITEAAEVIEDVVETVVTKEGFKLGKAGLIVGVVAAAGYGIYKGVKFIKNKKASKNAEEATQELAEEDFVEDEVK